MDQTPSTSLLSLHKKTFILSTIFIVLLILGGIWGYRLYTGYKQPNTAETINLNKDINTLYKGQPSFKEAWDSMGQGNYAQALELMKKVPTSNDEEYSFVQYQIAHLQFSLDRPEGIKALFVLLKDSRTNNLTKSLIMNILATKVGSTLDPSLLPNIQGEANTLASASTSQALLLQLVQATNRNQAMIAMYEISSSYHPLADSEAMLAFLYAKKAAEAKAQSKTDDVQKYVALAKQHIIFSDTSLPETVNKTDLQWMYPYITMHKGMALQYLRQAGEQTEDPAPYFFQAISIANDQRDPVAPFIRYNFATYLHSISPETKDQKDTIISLLKPIVENKGATSTQRFYEYAKNAIKNKDTNIVPNLTALGTLYPPFREAIKK